MKRLKSLLVIIGGLLTSLALTVGVASAGAHCMLIFHQPKVPQGMNKFMKKAKC